MGLKSFCIAAGLGLTSVLVAAGPGNAAQFDRGMVVDAKFCPPGEFCGDGGPPPPPPGGCSPGDPGCFGGKPPGHRPPPPGDCRPGDPGCFGGKPPGHHPPPPGDHHHHYHNPGIGFDFWWSPGYRPDSFYYDPPGYYSEWVSCRDARYLLQDEGFRNVRLMSCGGTYHKFTARWRGHMFKVKVRARNGRIIIGERL